MKKLEKVAKLKLLKELSDKMSEILMSERGDDETVSPEDMMEDLEGHEMQKVSIMAPDKESLVKGLSKAEEIIDDDDLDLDDLELEDEEEDELY